MTFEFISDFQFNTKSFSQIEAFIKQDTTSPYLIEARKDKPLKKSLNPFKKDTEEPEKSFNPFSQIAKSKSSGEAIEEAKEEAYLESSEKLNDSVNEMTEEDYQDVGELAIEFTDFLIDKVFIYLGRQPSKNNALADSKKKRLKIVIGKLMQKHEVKLSMEFIAVTLFASYVNSKWASSKKIQDEVAEVSKPKLKRVLKL